MARPGLGPLGIRLAAAFVGVALLAVAAFAVVMVIADRNDINRLAAAQRNHTAAAVAASLERAYQQAGGWQGANFDPTTEVAAATGTAFELISPDGTRLAQAGGFGGSRSTIERRTISNAGRPVGTVQVAFPSGGLSASEMHLRSSLLSAVGWSALLAAAGALLVAVLVARGLVRPIRRLLGAVRGFKLDGDRGAQLSVPESAPNHDLSHPPGPGELGELARAFDELTASLQREDRLRRVLIADVAHELRTPIAVLQAETEALLDGLHEPSPDALTSLRDETVRVGRMVDDLQTLASAEAAGLHLERRRLDFARIGAEAADSLASRFQAAGVTLDRDLPPTVVVGDPGRLHQVVTNLLANALKFTPAGGRVTVTIRTDGHDALLQVADTGPGVPPAEQALVWERFYRGEAARATGGSGIGLAVVKELVAAHGGTVALHSRPGGGAAFEVRLPVACAA